MRRSPDVALAKSCSGSLPLSDGTHRQSIFPRAFRYLIIRLHSNAALFLENTNDDSVECKRQGLDADIRLGSIRTTFEWPTGNTFV